MSAHWIAAAAAALGGVMNPHNWHGWCTQGALVCFWGWWVHADEALDAEGPSTHEE